MQRDQIEVATIDRRFVAVFNAVRLYGLQAVGESGMTIYIGGHLVIDPEQEKTDQKASAECVEQRQTADPAFEDVPRFHRRPRALNGLEPIKCT